MANSVPHVMSYLECQIGVQIPEGEHEKQCDYSSMIKSKTLQILHADMILTESPMCYQHLGFLC